MVDAAEHQAVEMAAAASAKTVAAVASAASMARAGGISAVRKAMAVSAAVAVAAAMARTAQVYVVIILKVEEQMVMNVAFHLHQIASLKQAQQAMSVDLWML